MQVLCSSVVIAGTVQLPLTNVHTHVHVYVYVYRHTHKITLDHELLIFNVKQRE